jgi:hypothetical protein
MLDDAPLGLKRGDAAIIGKVIETELDIEESKPRAAQDTDRLAMLYRALFDNIESADRGLIVQRAPDGLLEQYQALWNWIAAEVARIKPGSSR